LEKDFYDFSLNNVGMKTTKTSKHAIRITPENKQEINRVSDDIAKSLKDFVNQKDVENKKQFSLITLPVNTTVYSDFFNISIDDPYSQKKHNINIKVNLVVVARIDIEAALRNGNVELNVPVHTCYSRKHQSLAMLIKSCLVHEIAHIVDPKSQIERKETSYAHLERGTPDFWDAYVTDRGEIDAYHTELTQLINENLDNGKINMDGVLEFLRSPPQSIEKVKKSLGISYILSQIIVTWQNNYPDIFKLFKQRLYTSLMED
jgi:hypothetical protein